MSAQLFSFESNGVSEDVWLLAVIYNHQRARKALVFLEHF